MSSLPDVPEGSTYFDRAQAEQKQLAGGRFKAEFAAPVTGVPSYPPQPANSPWHHEAVPTEPPLGVSVEDME